MRAGTILIAAAVLAMAHPGAASPAGGQELAGGERVDTIVVRPPLFSLTLPARYTEPRLDFSLTAPARPNLSGFELHRLSPMESTLKGAGAGMTLGFMAGALGEMGGAWDEKSAFGIAGAAAIFGALYGNSRADDRGWSLQIRLDRDGALPGSTLPPR
ncbi:MAG: hypothetical protein PHQ19_07165 [Candidatus Krumholzibacteria bacterium]|nr:hypothetical protein [Candidatus Krumholzibacteria bacterium]